MKEIIAIRAKKTNACAGMYGLDAEATVLDTVTGETLYVSANWYDGEEHYVVATESLYDFMTGQDDEGDEDEGDESDELWSQTYQTKDGFTTNNPFFLFAEGAEERLKELEDKFGPIEVVTPYKEEYGKLSEAKQSEYYKVFLHLSNALKLMCNWPD